MPARVITTTGKVHLVRTWWTVGPGARADLVCGRRAAALGCDDPEPTCRDCISVAREKGWMR